MFMVKLCELVDYRCVGIGVVCVFKELYVFKVVFRKCRELVVYKGEIQRYGKIFLQGCVDFFGVGFDLIEIVYLICRVYGYVCMMWVNVVVQVKDFLFVCGFIELLYGDVFSIKGFYYCMIYFLYCCNIGCELVWCGIQYIVVWCFGDDQIMIFGVWYDVYEDIGVFIFIEFFRWDFFVQDFGENIVGIVVYGLGCFGGIKK